MSLMIFLFFSSASDFSEELSDQNDIEILAHTCFWYKVPWYQQANTAPVDGQYDSWKPEVTARQNKEKNEYGIDTDVLSWHGPGSYHETWMNDGYFGAENFNTRKFCILYEAVPCLGESLYYDFSDPILKDKFLWHMSYVADKYGPYPGCRKENNKPIVYIWNGEFKNFGQASQEAREKVYLVGPEYIMFPPDESETQRIENLKWWDAITTYGILACYIAEKYDGQLTFDAIVEFAEAVVKWDAILKLYAPKTDLWIPGQFAYHDNRGNPKLESTKEQAEMFAKTVKALALATKRKKILWISYNEHYEGTGLERSEEHGDYWLSLIRDHIANNSNDPPLVDYQIANTIYKERTKVGKNRK